MPALWLNAAAKLGIDAAYLAAAPGRLAWLERKLAETGGPAVGTLDRSAESLVPLWRWFVSWHDAGGGADGSPWYAADPAGPPALTPATLWVVDGIGYHVAEVVRTMTWRGEDCTGRATDLCKVSDTGDWRSLHRHRPQSHGPRARPTRAGG